MDLIGVSARLVLLRQAMQLRVLGSEARALVLDDLWKNSRRADPMIAARTQQRPSEHP
jgi:hypothetical protein